MLKKILLLVACCILNPLESAAQLIPDNTLGSESSTIRSIDELTDAIEGGAIRGDNLFHSFSEFNVGEGTRVGFANPEGISNIFSRVTGSNISEIFGTLGVNGTANLFLMNPNGIVFGENAAINIGGSFLATTAESIELESGDRFSAVEANRPLLTIDFPIGLGLGRNSGDIVVQGKGYTLELDALTPTPSTQDQDFSLFSPKNIGLIGGNIFLHGAVIGVSNGNIEVGAVKNNGYVGFQPSEWIFDYSEVEQLGNVFLNSKSLLNTVNNNSGSGSIRISANNARLENASLILNQNRGFSVSDGIQINSSNLEIVGGILPDDVNGSIDSIPTSITSESTGSGRSNIIISTDNLSLIDGGQISSVSIGTDKGADISITASNLIELLDVFPSTRIFSSIRSTALNTANGGDLKIESANISLVNGGSINSNTIGPGKAGDLSINVMETTSISGFTPTSFTPSSITSVGFNTGDTGNVSLNTEKLELKNAGSVSSLSTGLGNAGEVTVNASDSILIEGRIFEEPILASAIASSVEEILPLTTEFFEAEFNPRGNAGNVTINASKLKILNGGIVAVRNTGTGNAGSLKINAEEVALNNGGEISASTVSGEGGNITLNVENLELTNQSQISASAGVLGNGGNITINSDTILAISNSDITANAVEGDGGNITITSDVILGFETRNQITSSSDITASSELGIDGTITISSPENNSDEDLIISAKEVDFYTNQQLFPDGCNNRDGGGMKIAYLNSGSPESPDNFFDDEEPLSLQSGEQSVSYLPEVESEDNVPPLWKEGDPVIEGNMIQTNSDGSVYFVAVDKEKTVESMVCTREAEDRKRK